MTLVYFNAVVDLSNTTSLASKTALDPWCSFVENHLINPDEDPAANFVSDKLGKRWYKNEGPGKITVRPGQRNNYSKDDLNKWRRKTGYGLERS